MMLFKISHGPWEKLFEGNFQKKEVGIYSNPNSIILVLIFEKESKKIVGAVVELFKAFAVTGEIEGFIETLPREIVLLVKHNKKQSNKFLMIGSTPSYSEWSELPFIEEVDKLLKKLDTASVIFEDISKSYEFRLEEINKADNKMKKAFFAEPLIVPVLSTKTAYSKEDSESFADAKGEFNVGLTKERQSIVEPIELFFKTLVTGGEKNDRIRFLHVLAESFLLSKISIVIFDLTHSFRGLNSPSNELTELQKYNVSLEPIGFPLKVFTPVNDLKVDLNFVNATGFADTFGIGKNTAFEIMASTLKNNKVSGINDLIEKVKLTKITEKITAFEVRRSVRILKLISNNYPGLFEGKNDVKNITMSYTRTLGRASIIDLTQTEPKIVFLVIHNILSSLLEYYKNKKAKTIVILPEIKSLFSKNSNLLMEAEIEQILKQLEGIGVGISLSEGTGIDVSKEFDKLVEAKVNIVSKNDIGIQLKGRKSYRVFLRPPISVSS